MPVPMDLVPVAQAARIAGVHIQTIRAWMQKRQIRYYGRPGHFRISLADLLPEHGKDAQAPAQSKAPTRKRTRGVTASTPDTRYLRATAKRDASQSLPDGKAAMNEKLKSRHR